VGRTIFALSGRCLNHTGVILLLLLAGLMSFQGKAQQSIFDPPEKNNCYRSLKQAYIWYFGDKAGIDFNSGSAVPLMDQDVMTAYKASGVMSDSLGNLLFFTNGRKVWDRTFSLMPGCTELEGDVGVTQPCIIVPLPGNDRYYYIFTVDVLAFLPDNTYTTTGLTYTIVDMDGNNGLGEAKSHINVSLLTPVCQKITATLHANGRDMWVITHAWDSDAFYSYRLHPGGLDEPVISNTGTFQGGGYVDQINAIGYMKASPDGSKLALAITGTNQIETYAFNNQTGEIIFEASYTSSFMGINPYGIAFSPNSRMLYSSLLQITGNGPPMYPSRILQFDLNQGLTSPKVIDSVAGIRLGAMQLGPDGRIYISRTVNLISQRDSLDVIYNPTRPGLDCNYNLLEGISDSRFPLNGRHSIYSLPNFVQSYVDIPVFYYDSCCFEDVTQFHITNTANIDQVQWDFGDGNSSNDMEPIHLYAQPGTYTVTLTEFYNGQTFVDSMSLVVHDNPTVELGDTVMLYTGSVINLTATDSMQFYLWSTGGTIQTISVETQGDYWVEVTDWNCCSSEDTVYVKVFEYFVPNAFTPNGDGLNDVFRAVGLYQDIDFKMVIYNRWGQQIFESNSLDNGWNGEIKGKMAEADTYVWIIFVDFLGEDIITNGDVVLKGTVNLVR
jgi:gliding motility-associated-like protein